MVSLAMGIIVGPTIGRLIYEQTHDNSTILKAAAGMALFLIIYTVFLPESRPQELRVAEVSRIPPRPLHSRYPKESMSFPGMVKQLLIETLEPLCVFLPGRIEPTENVLPSRYTLLLLIAAYAFGQFGSNGITTVFIPYSNLVFNWNPEIDGYYFTFYGASTFVVYVAIFPALQYAYDSFTQQKESATISTAATTTATKGSINLPTGKDGDMINGEYSIITGGSAAAGDDDSAEVLLGAGVLVDGGVTKKDASIKKDLAIFVSGGVLMAVGFAIVPIFETGSILFIACAIHSLASIGQTAFTSLMTAYVPSHQTGMALGGVCILDTLLQATAALLYGLIFGHTSATVPSAVYIVSTGMWMMSLAVTAVILSEYRRRWAQQ
ncbi:hypothetical protein BGX24_005592 [Mortierella sp. AD032]|nr:hypothetical protein BGX24_005592 [Mortierella sp. AD032]